MNEEQLYTLNFYIEVNGVLELDKLKELLKASKINLSDNQIIDYIKDKEYIVEDNLIYYNDIAKLLNENYKINNIKKKEKYKVFTIEEIYNIDKSFEEANYQKQLEKIISKYIKDKQKLNDITNTIIDIVHIGYDIFNYIQSIYEREQIDITLGDSDDIDTIAMDIYSNYPSWKLNGFTQNELNADNDYEDFSNEEEPPFEEWSLDEQIDTYLMAYLIINGIIKIDKFLEILENEHNIKIRKSKLKKIIQEINIITIDDNYIKLEYLSEEEVNELINEKEGFDNYKIIDNIKDVITEHNNLRRKIDNICKEYKIPEYVKLYIEELTHKIRITENLLVTIFEASNIKLEHKKIVSIYQELKPYLDKARIWELNGYTILELKKKTEKKQKKIGRNELCPCGSGLKYKKCCGKN